jgi:hypothetical protein
MGIQATYLDRGDEPEDHVARALGQLAIVDTDFDFGTMQAQWDRRGALSLKQACLVIWRLSVCEIEHDPGTLGLWVSTRDSDREQMAALEAWQLARLIPYLSAEQRTDFGI